MVLTASDPRRLSAELAGYERAKQHLLARFPDIDDETLSDTLEGITDLHEILAALIRSALDDEALVEALSIRLDDMKTRQARLSFRAKAKRSLALDAMSSADVKRLVAPDLTASVREGGPVLDVIEMTSIPADYWKPQPPKLDRQRIINDLKSGRRIAGAELAPRRLQLTVRVK